MYKNMKIAINDQQPLDEVVNLLSTMGYEICLMSWRGYGYVVTESTGSFSDYTHDHDWMKDYPLTTLAELKEM